MTAADFDHSDEWCEALDREKTAKIAQLEGENAELRRAIPLLRDEGRSIWPSVHHNATVLTGMLFQALREIEELRELLQGGAPRVWGEPSTSEERAEAIRHRVEWWRRVDATLSRS